MVLTQIRARARRAPRTLFAGREQGGFRFGSKLEQTIVRKVGRAVHDHKLIEDGDRIMVCLSGGKDSYVLLDALRVLQRRSPVRYELIAVNVDQGWPDYETSAIKAHLEREGVEHHMASATYAQIVEAKLQPGQTPCSLCSRFRRAYLYDLAPKLGCTKIALGHHADDLCETLLLNMFFSGRLASMPPKLLAEDGRNTVIRPLAYVLETETTAFSEARGYPIVRCGCLSCGLPDQKRQVVKRLLGDLDQGVAQGLKRSILAAMGNVNVSHLLDPNIRKSIQDVEEAS